MQVVVDTNVLVSGLINPYGPPGRILQLIAIGRVSVVYDIRVIEEYREVLLRPRFDFDADKIESILEQIRHGGNSVVGSILDGSLPDRDDEQFLEVALAGNVDYLITGNSKHFPKKHCKGIHVVSPSEFLDHYKNL